MKRLTSLALTLVLWLPVVAALLLFGVAVGWWLVAVGGGVLIVVLVPAMVLASRLRRGVKPDREAINAELRRLDVEFVRWFKWWGLVMGVITLALFVVLLVAIASGELR
jgi:uncharacterized ion transporter superfamily protein YfcC